MKPNILLIVLDAVRSDHLGCYGHNRATSPTIDRLAENGVRYSNAFANSNWTAASHGSIFTGLLPSKSGVYGENQSLPKGHPTLGDELKSAGYTTFATSAGVHIRNERGYGRGIDQFDESYRIRPNRKYLREFLTNPTAIRQAWFTGTRGHDNYTYYKFQRLKKSFKDSNEPFFGFLNCKTAHHPYNPPRPYKSMFVDGLNRPRYEFVEHFLENAGFEPQAMEDIDIDRLRNLSKHYPVIAEEFEPTEREWEIVKAWYDGAIRYLDDRLGKLIDFLETEGLREETTIIITSDHGDLFGEHGLEKHQYSLFDDLIRVPLIINGPDTGSHVHSNPVSLVDLYPTILDLAGKSVKESDVATSLLPLVRETTHDYLFAEVGRKSLDPISRRHPGFQGSRYNGPMQSIRSATHKLITYRDGRDELYKWRSDPHESDDVSESLPKIVDSLKTELAAVTDAMNESTLDENIADSRLEQQLKDLGYK